MAKKLSNPLPTTVAHLLLKYMDTLTRSEKQLANTILENYPVSGMPSITELAEMAGVSTPTVVRMARKIGFDGFSELQRAVRTEVYATLQDPLKKLDAWQPQKDNAHFINQFADAVANNVRNTLQRLDYDTFDTVAALLADSSKHVYLTGGRITRSNADYLFNHLQIIRPNVTDLGTSANIWPQYVVDMNKHSVVLIFDIRRYESNLAKLAKLAVDRGSSVVLFTDQWGSPISRQCTHRFDAFVEVPSSWDSSISIMLLLEALIASIQDRCGQGSRKRINELETMFGKTKLFRRFD